MIHYLYLDNENICILLVSLIIWTWNGMFFITQRALCLTYGFPLMTENQFNDNLYNVTALQS